MNERELLDLIEQVVALLEIAKDQYDWIISKKALNILMDIQETNPGFLDKQDRDAIVILSDGIQNRDVTMFNEVIDLLTISPE